jgi:hypothetical protein
MGRVMKKTTVYFSIDVAQGIVALLLFVSSLLLWVVFPKGFYPSYLLWIDIHKWSGVALTVLVILHVVLHWRWIVQKARSLITDTKVKRSAAIQPQPSTISTVHPLDPLTDTEIGYLVAKQTVAGAKNSGISDTEYS